MTTDKEFLIELYTLLKTQIPNLSNFILITIEKINENDDRLELMSEHLNADEVIEVLEHALEMVNRKPDEHIIVEAQ